MRSTLHHLAQRGTAKTWYVVKALPRDLQPQFGGKRHLLRNLKTTDLAVALAKRTSVLAEVEAEIAKARLPGRTSSVFDAAETLRQTARTIPDHDTFALYAWQDGVQQSADELRHRYGRSVAETFSGIATGTATLLQLHLESWLAEPGNKGPLTERTKAQRRSIIGSLETWLRSTGRAATVQAVTREVAGEFIVKTMVEPAMDPITANARISALSTFWKWLVRRAGITENPWQNQSFRKPSKRTKEDRDKNKRPFTDAELAALLAGPADQEMADVIRIAALTGMRRSEIFKLQVGDCLNSVFDITASKSEAGVRMIPIHSQLAEIIARRTHGKRPTDLLISEHAEVKGRADAFGKRFKTYRMRMGVDDTPQGRRQSRIDFHSFRRWLSTHARNAGFDRATVAAIVGHEAGNITDDVYSAGPTMEMKRRCVEAVRLPE